MSSMNKVIVCCCVAVVAAYAMSSIPSTKEPLPALVTDGGPDIWGYQYIDSDSTGAPGQPVFSWIDIRSVGTRVNGLIDDNTAGPFALGFEFPVYWLKYSNFIVGSNGYIAFDEGYQSAHPFPDIPSPQRPNNILAALMSDLDFSGLAGNRGCWYWTNSAADTFIIQCESVPFWAVPASNNTFEIILSKRDSAISFQYLEQSGAPYLGWGAGNVTVGIENITGYQAGLRYNYGNTPAWNNIHAGLAVRFFPPATSSYQMTDAMCVNSMTSNSGGMFWYYPPTPLPVWVKVMNSGNQPITAVPVTAEITDASGTIVWPGSATVPALAVGEQTTVSFGNWFPTARGTYMLKVKTGLAGDQYHPNDSILVEIRVVNYTFPTVLSYDSIQTGYYALSGPHGTCIKFEPPRFPAKLDTAYFWFSTMTPIDVLIYNDNGGRPGEVIDSIHWTPTAAGAWSSLPLADRNIHIQSGPFYLGYKTTGASPAIGYDGNLPHSRQNFEYTGDWAPNRFNETQDLRIRTRITVGTPAYNLGVTEILAPAGTIDSGTVVAPRARVHNFGLLNATGATATYTIPSSPPYRETLTFNLTHDADSVFTFPSWTAIPGFGTIPRCSVHVTGDPEPANDTLSGAPFSVRYIDVAAAAIIQPVDTISTGQVITPMALIQNIGNTAELVPVTLQITGTGYQANDTLYLGVGEAGTAEFPDWTAVAGTYTVRCSTMLSTDMVEANNVATAPLLVSYLDAQPVSIDVPVGTVDSGAPVAPLATVRNNSNVARDIPVQLSIAPSYVATGTAFGVGPGLQAQVTFGTTWQPTRGSHAMRCVTSMTGDALAANDTIYDTVDVAIRDVRPVSIDVPAATIDSGGGPVTPLATVRNDGTALASFGVQLTVGASYTGTASVTDLAPGDTQQVSFTPALDIPARGPYPMSCVTQLTGDMVPANDTLAGSTTVHVNDVAVSSVIYPTGDVPENSIVSPQASLVNYGTRDAICNVTMIIWSQGASIYYVIETDTVPVGGTPVTHTFAQTWPASPLGDYLAEAFVTLAGDINPANDDDTAAFRVVAGSVTDVGVNTIIAPSGNLPEYTAVQPAATIVNMGNVAATCDLRFIIEDSSHQVAYDQLATGISVPLGTPVTYQFATPWAATPQGTFYARAFTICGADNNPANDTAHGQCTVVPGPTMDAGVLRVNAPAGTVDTSMTLVPSATVKNFGSVTTGFSVFMEIRDSLGSLLYGDFFDIVNLAPGDTIRHDFGEWLRPHAIGAYAARCSTSLAGDANASNDTLSVLFSVTAPPPWTAGWQPMCPVPKITSVKAVRDGGWLAVDGSFIYGAKGYKTQDLYRYNPAADTWSVAKSIPMGRENKLPYRGAVGCGNGNGLVFATKGNNTQGFYRYDVALDSWRQMKDVPLGYTNKKVKYGTDLAFVTRGGTDYLYLLKGYKNEFWRYDIAGDSWTAMPNAPSASRVKWGAGSWLAFDGDRYIYAHKARYNELWRYDIAADQWDTNPPLLHGMTFVGQSGRSKKAKEGSSGAYYNEMIYALKGGNTVEFWKYSIVGDTWSQLDTIPLIGRGSVSRRKVKAGADLVNFGGIGAFFALKGNKTTELWRYVTYASALPAARLGREGVMADTRLTIDDCRLTIAPNPLNGGFTTVRYNLSQAGPVTVTVHDVAGRVVASRALLAGRSGAAQLDLSGLSAGVYVVRLRSGTDAAACKLVVRR